MNREEADMYILRLPEMSTAELCQLWAALFGTACYSRRRAFICRRLEWRINTLVSGGLSDRAKKRVYEIADDTLLRVRSRGFRPRTSKVSQERERVIRKKYKGVDYEVYQRADGFIYNGKKYATLSEVSTAIAGYFVSGKRFFGISAQVQS